jgi:APA family basic amino acid/polyamine antiporter
MAVGLVRLHRRPGYAPPYRAWGYPLVPVVFSVAAVVVACIQIAADPGPAATGLLFVVLGLPVYYLWIRPSPHAHH